MASFFDLVMPVAGYVAGAVPFGVIIARAKGVDLFKAGSGNVGATNVGRLLGKPLGYLVFLCDFLKGFVPSAVAVWVQGGPDVIAVITGLAAILGHMFSPLLRFRGGKGVATGAGVVSVLLPLPTGLAVLAFVATILASCTMSLASITASIVLALSQASMSSPTISPTTVFALLVAILVIGRHRNNVTRLMAGTESQLLSLQRLARFTPGAHALALGSWCGAAWFFSFGVAPNLFSTSKDLVTNPPTWFSLRESNADVASQLAGALVGPMFPRYFLLQAICGVIATGIAVGWLITRPARSTRWRAVFLIAAILLVALGWPVSRHVSDLRAIRFDDEAAKAAFATWHGISLSLNLVVLALLAAALALAGYVAPPRDCATNAAP